jgi:carbon monoxide dehydrogenase subunit G
MRILTIPCIPALVLGVALLTPPSSTAADWDVETSRKGDVIEVHAQATLRAPLATVWGTLTDYERLPEFVPGMKTSRVIARKGATATVAQTGEAHFLFFKVPIDVTVESTEQAPHTIEVRRIAGSVRHLQGRYEAQVLADPAQVQLRWTGSIAPESDWPPLIGPALVRNLIKAQFAGLVREIERRAATQALAGRLPPSTP